MIDNVHCRKGIIQYVCFKHYIRCLIKTRGFSSPLTSSVLLALCSLLCPFHEEICLTLCLFYLASLPCQFHHIGLRVQYISVMWVFKWASKLSPNSWSHNRCFWDIQWTGSWYITIILELGNDNSNGRTAWEDGRFFPVLFFLGKNLQKKNNIFFFKGNILLQIFFLLKSIFAKKIKS